ncbi:MAG TPA: hypothetical protein VGD88_06235 [Opitutaceae bacterium]
MSAPKITARDVQRLVAVLGEQTEWATAAELAVLIYGTPSESNKRRIRLAAAAAGDGVVSYPGSPGYKLWRHCTFEEKYACPASFNAQITDMKIRRDMYRARLHREYPAQFNPTPELRPSREQLALL